MGDWENKHLLDRNRAYTAVWDAVRSGKVKRGKCAVCGATRTQAHHDGKYVSTKNITWLCDKHHRIRHMRKSVEVIKLDDSQHLVYLITAKPNTLDTDRQWFEPEDVEAMAHYYLVYYRLGEAHIFEEHETKLHDVFLVQSYIAPVDFVMNEKQVSKGAWITVLWVPNDKVWGKIQKRELIGASVRGPAVLSPDQMPTQEHGSSIRDKLGVHAGG